MSILETYLLQNKQEMIAKHMFPIDHMEESIVVVKAISEVLENLGYPVKALEEMELFDTETFEKAKLELVRMLSVAALHSKRALKESEMNAVYSPSEIARMTGLSHTTISKYIDAGRFEDIKREESGKHVDIKGSTRFTYPSGISIFVYEIAMKYRERMRRAEIEEQMDELQFIESKIKGYEELHGSIKALEERVSSGETLDSSSVLDLDVWKYLNQRRESLVCR